MAKNYVQDGNAITLSAPVGGVVSGGIYAIGKLVVVALGTAEAGEPFTGQTHGVWRVPAAAGLKTGDEVGLADGELVALTTPNEAAPVVGKLVADEAGGFAHVRLSN